ncbi:prepilin-type N-terminal cleavage/methylation domain-containing protein [Dyella sp. ASV21]|uniref:PilW family protein n=1 Tax=Dyella sp. ASV21 TaxID=2795114 RepID=UPI0018EA4F8A|nr:prepilin-type N-terminal cleavage/methylation domain-containing protein [Dyella sp. ASV21]
MRRCDTTLLTKRTQSRGFTLVELMVAMLLGLVVMGGVVSVFITNQQVYRSNRALSDVQDSARLAFEMIARDIRIAGLTGCENSGRIANVLNNSAANWYTNWNNPIIGYTAGQTDSAAPSRTANTESLMLLGVEGTAVTVKANTEPSAVFTINESSTNLQKGDIVVVCDLDHAAIVQLSSVSGTTLTHAATGTPGNCTLDLSFPTVCSSTSSYVFAPNAQIARLTAADWYVSSNGDNGTSLYRASVTINSTSGAASITRNEMVRDVTGLAMTYHQSGDASFVTADNVTAWPSVDAVRVTLTMISVDRRAGTNNKPVSRTFTSTITLRNRVA